MVCPCIFSFANLLVEHPSIVVENGEFAWKLDGAADSFKLTNVNVEIRQPGLNMIVGRVGSGKSSLFHALLGIPSDYDTELHFRFCISFLSCLLVLLSISRAGNIPKVSGSVSMSGRVSYVPQIPWIFSASIRDNILFGKEFKEDLYAKVIAVSELNVCSLCPHELAFFRYFFFS
jgi:ABC-type transport system involved in cytochrome bd biosynthesis fused ATPase/permease subunit